MRKCCQRRDIPRVVTARAWVSPLVKRALPCTLGRQPALLHIALTSVTPLPSTLYPSSRINLLVALDATSCVANSVYTYNHALLDVADVCNLSAAHVYSLCHLSQHLPTSVLSQAPNLVTNPLLTPLLQACWCTCKTHGPMLSWINPIQASRLSSLLLASCDGEEGSTAKGSSLCCT